MLQLATLLYGFYGPSLSLVWVRFMWGWPMHGPPLSDPICATKTPSFFIGAKCCCIVGARSGSYKFLRCGLAQSDGFHVMISIFRTVVFIII